LAEFYDSVDEPSINEKHHSLLAKLIQDSELDLKHLSMSIASRLYPIPSSVLNSEAQISDSILKIAYRVDYGIQDSAKEANHIWRWEVFNEHLLPESSRSLVIERRNRRIQIAEKINTAIVSLSEQERLILMSTKKSAKVNNYNYFEKPY
jgi:hypothetical protein